MTASSPDSLRVLFPQNVCQYVGLAHREGQGFLIPRMYAQADPETEADRMDSGDPVPLAQSVTVNVQKHSEGERLLKVAWD